VQGFFHADWQGIQSTKIKFRFDCGDPIWPTFLSDWQPTCGAVRAETLPVRFGAWCAVEWPVRTGAGSGYSLASTNEDERKRQAELVAHTDGADTAKGYVNIADREAVSLILR
jgi:hypothetical protein